MKIAIVDDIETERKLLRKRLETQLTHYAIHADILEYENGEQFLTVAKKQPFTIVFLDIYMDGMTGIETATKLRTFDSDFLLIFTTTSIDHALEGFRVRAMHYLVKPYNEEEIKTLIEEILQRIPMPDKYMDIKVNGSILRLPFRDIIFAEHSSHMMHIHVPNKRTFITRQSFSDFTAPLKEDERFFLCNRGVIVNMEHAIDFNGTAFLMDDDNTVFVSRNLLKSARQTFMEFLFKKGHN